MRGIYEYQPQGPDELAVKEGELIELSPGSSGGQNYADGWWEGQFINIGPVHLRELTLLARSGLEWKERHLPK